MSKQPFYHEASFLFTATADLADALQKASFRKKFATFLRQELGNEILADSVMVESTAAEPGDPRDL